MNLRIMPKLVAGTMLATAALGMTGCGNRTNPKHEPSEDVFVKTETVSDIDLLFPDEEENTVERIKKVSEPIENEIMRLPEVTYERNKKCEKRTSWDHDEYLKTLKDDDYDTQNWAKDKIAQRNKFYEARGTYGASMLMQKLSDSSIKGATIGAAKDYFLDKAADYAGLSTHEIRDIFKKFMKNPDEPNIQKYLEIPAVQDYIVFKYYHNKPFYLTDEDAKIIESDEHMFDDKPLSAVECLGYLDDQLAGVENLSMDDYEKIIDDVESFAESKRPLTVEDMAEVVAFKQYKTDSVTTRAYFKDNNWWSPEIRKEFEYWCDKIRNRFFK